MEYRCRDTQTYHARRYADEAIKRKAQVDIEDVFNAVTGGLKVHYDDIAEGQQFVPRSCSPTAPQWCVFNEGPPKKIRLHIEEYAFEGVDRTDCQLKALSRFMCVRTFNPTIRFRRPEGA